MLVLFLLTVPALCREPSGTDGAPGPVAFVVGDPAHRFDSESVGDAWIAVHILPTVGSDGARSYIREYTENGATVAGVRHIFVTPEPPDEFREALAFLPSAEDRRVFNDPGARLAALLSVPIPVTAPSLVVLDPSRHELLRATGESPSDFLPFAAFAKRVGEATEDNGSRRANTASGLALKGYDPTAYLDEQRAVQGDRKYESAFRGIAYRFASDANRRKFAADPAKYVPAYGGWCATAMAEGEEIEVDPKNFRVMNGRTFLFYKGLFGNALNDWKNDERTLTAKADAHWTRVTAGQ